MTTAFGSVVSIPGDGKILFLIGRFGFFCEQYGLWYWLFVMSFLTFLKGNVMIYRLFRQTDLIIKIM